LGAPIDQFHPLPDRHAETPQHCQTAKIQNDNTAQMLEQADELTRPSPTWNTVRHLQQVTATTHDLVVPQANPGRYHELRDHIADFDDFFGRFATTFIGSRHCFDIPVCWSIRSGSTTLDGIDKVTDDLGSVVNSTERLDTLMPQMLATLRDHRVDENDA